MKSVGYTRIDVQRDTVGFVAHCVCKESNLSCEMGMGVNNYRAC